MTFKRIPCGDWINLNLIEVFCISIYPTGKWGVIYFLFESDSHKDLFPDEFYDTQEEAQQALDDWMGA